MAGPELFALAEFDCNLSLTLTFFSRKWISNSHRANLPRYGFLNSQFRSQSPEWGNVLDQKSRSGHKDEPGKPSQTKTNPLKIFDSDSYNF